LEQQTMAIDIHILVENRTAHSHLLAEHGFSCLIEQDGVRYLFDTGAGKALPHNLAALGGDLQGLKAIVLSHGHYDHSGGLLHAVQASAPVTVWGHASLFDRHMVADPGKAPRFVGCPFSRADLEDAGARLTLVEKTTALGPGIQLVCGIARSSDGGGASHDPRLTRQVGSRLMPDPIDDDASLLIEDQSGGPPILILGCAHAGIINILDHLRDKMNISRLRAIIGGTHLLKPPPEGMEKILSKLDQFQIDMIAPCHCTGERAAARLEEHFRERYKQGKSGSVFRL
jgi:7,8-dihydropterin-6-yl-methyl-4-(beta-D-ribofuranosyl)aminobenzene 5'-phosphate synthase